ncbi:MAG: ribonuclease HI [Deferrisomatales bacterium]|nr:ribonuclease HI [Deferrisomatales bacterium]
MKGGRREATPDLWIYTDGACAGNPGPGGWGAVLLRGGRYEELGGGESHTTNNRMEMRAALEGLRRARPGERAHVVTDSRYLHDGISRWIHAWKRRGWRKADGGEVLNRDLWEALDEACRRPGVPVTWEHVRGHSGHALNERCDAIATAFSRGESPALRSGDGKWIPGVGDGGLAPGLSYPLYLSLVDGELRVHPDWADCESWVRGAKGARFRKVKDPSEVAGSLEAWGLAPDAARRLGLG